MMAHQSGTQQCRIRQRQTCLWGLIMERRKAKHNKQETWSVWKTAGQNWVRDTLLHPFQPLKWHSLEHTGNGFQQIFHMHCRIRENTHWWAQSAFEFISQNNKGDTDLKRHSMSNVKKLYNNRFIRQLQTRLSKNTLFL